MADLVRHPNCKFSLAKALICLDRESKKMEEKTTKFTRTSFSGKVAGS